MMPTAEIRRENEAQAQSGGASGLEVFALRPAEAATVSEISEATAASPVPPEQRVNFHIGNPVQDARLVELYARIALGLEARVSGCPTQELPERLRAELEWPQERKPVLQFLVDLIARSGPYLPRGGFLKHKPPELVELFVDWLARQQEPLQYDLGETSGRRELILAAGGPVETLRVFFHGLNDRLLFPPATVFCFRFSIPGHFRDFAALRFRDLPDSESAAVAQLEAELGRNGRCPYFLLLGAVVQEETRRAVRRLCLSHPLFVIEASDAPNQASLAREARMMNRTLRLLSPAVLRDDLAGMGLVFVAGYHEFVELIESTHFQLKGTPSAAEVELLTFLLKRVPRPAQQPAFLPADDFRAELSPDLPEVQTLGARAVARSSRRVDRLIGARVSGFERKMAEVSGRVAARVDRLVRLKGPAAAVRDPLESAGLREILDGLPRNGPVLQEAFKAVFLRHHPEYEAASCVVVSGSARTALSLLGFHCGIREVFVPDLSWTYEHCFPRVTAVPLRPDLSLDVEGILKQVKERVSEDPQWRHSAAVVLNNPHNATGKVFSAESVRKLLLGLLEFGLWVIDDLSYENVAPSTELAGPPTLRQLSAELLRTGYITEEQSNRVITVHSLSKTDCLAGARLAVVEIREENLRLKFAEVNSHIRPNLGALLAAYLFYRGSLQQVTTYWRLRNQLLHERMSALEQALAQLPRERNPFEIVVVRPEGSMYPRLTLGKLPAGLSLDWIASTLAVQGIGLVPLSTFARTEQGVEMARNSFRLTLGGTDDGARLLAKTRRVLIDLNRIIAEQESQYNRRRLGARAPRSTPLLDVPALVGMWQQFARQVGELCPRLVQQEGKLLGERLDDTRTRRALGEFLADRLTVFEGRFRDRLEIWAERLARLQEDGSRARQVLEVELSGDSLARRQALFRQRLYDRTVHPTQMYSLEAELVWEKAIQAAITGRALGPLAEPLARELAREFLGLNVAIDSRAEGKELLLDLDILIYAEDYLRFFTSESWETFLSYWGDWDGSNRPSGQGHHLVATVLMENVERMHRLLAVLERSGSRLRIEPRLRQEVSRLPQTTARFRRLLDEITSLTHQLERRYRGLLPLQVRTSRWRDLAIRLHLAPDPVKRLYEHNDRLERKMRDLRRRRRETLAYYFELNRSLQNCLRDNLPGFVFPKNDLAALAVVAGFRDLMRRFVLTPRIHQNMITSADPFAIETTAHNLVELNELGGRSGIPGLVLALQISMATEAEALISLERKLRSRREEVLRTSQAEIPPVALIPLFEDLAVVRNIPNYLEKLWEYAVQSRALNQSPRDRFAEMVAEVFIAGSDLSQQVGQAAGRAAFREAKYEISRWLAEKDLIGAVRVKMGCGEPMQRQGGYYAPVSGAPAFEVTPENLRLLAQHASAAAAASARHSATPLMGILAASDLVTFQSNLSERLRMLRLSELAQLLYHVRESQAFQRQQLQRAAEPLRETRLRFTERGLQELRRLTIGFQDEAFEEFCRLATENFRHILYGRPEDVVGIYVLSYFIARTLPALRDRPTVRPAPGPASARGQLILERIAATIPLSRHGSSLRAIAHNQAQTMLLGLNQLTTGLFRAIHLFGSQHGGENDSEAVLASRVLPHLPVYEILHTLRLYQESPLRRIWQLERAFPAGNSAFTALREDVDFLRSALPLFQKELVRRHGLPVQDFFEGNRFKVRLLPTLRPDLAVLLQPDLFNTSLDVLLDQAGPRVTKSWAEEVSSLLALRDRIQAWRDLAWEVLYEPVFSRVSMFVELATALYTVTSREQVQEARPAPLRLPTPALARPLVRSAAEDSLQQFLAAALEYFAAVPKGTLELPTNVIRALKEARRLLRIEEEALDSRQQALIRFCLLQIGRLAGENG